MKTKRSIFKPIFFNVILLLLCVSCEPKVELGDSNTSKPTELPPITKTGENTFGCLINGELFVPYHIPDFTGGCGGAVAGIGYGNYGTSNQYFYLDINGHECLSESAIQITLREFVLDTGVYYLNYDTWSNVTTPGDHGVYYRTPEIVYNTGDGCRGICQITKFDTLNKIVAGVFAFEVCNDSVTLSITEGRFDVHFLY